MNFKSAQTHDAPAPPPAPMRARAHDQAGAALAPIRIVTIDDQADLRRLYRLALESADMHVVGEAADGRAGVHVVADTQPDLVLLDLSMPTMDGLEAIIAIRKANPDARVVILSGFTRDRLGPVVQELGAVDYIEKGVRPRELVQRLRDAARQSVPPWAEPTPVKLQAMQNRLRQLI